MTTPDAVVALTEADRWIDRVVAQRDHLPEAAELADVESQLRTLLEAMKKVQAELTPLDTAYQEANATAQSLHERGRALTQRLEQSTAGARELDALAHEAETVRARASEADDTVLSLLEVVEPLQDQVATIKRDAAPLVERRTALQQTIAELQATLNEEIAALRIAREARAHDVEPAWLARYEAAMKRVGTSGAAFVESGRCDGCRIALSPLDLDRFKQGDLGECPECGRLLLP
jgi:predicted  nucleic acid-binding Zn-ribbon protein